LYSRLEYEALEPQIDFLAFLVAKLEPENPKSLKIWLSYFRGFPYKIYAHFAITFEPEMLENPSNPLKTRIVA